MSDDPGRTWLRRYSEIVGLGETVDDASQLEEIRANFAPLDALWQVEVGDTEPALDFEPLVRRRPEHG